MPLCKSSPNDWSGRPGIYMILLMWQDLSPSCAYIHCNSISSQLSCAMIKQWDVNRCHVFSVVPKNQAKHCKSTNRINQKQHHLQCRFWNFSLAFRQGQQLYWHARHPQWRPHPQCSAAYTELLAVWSQRFSHNKDLYYPKYTSLPTVQTLHSGPRSSIFKYLQNTDCRMDPSSARWDFKAAPLPQE